MIDEDKIILKNVITGKRTTYKKSTIKGYRIEKYKWNIIKVSGIRSFWEYESKMVVLYSNFKAVIHLKSYNYFGIKKIIEKLESQGYSQLLKHVSFFDKYKYRKI